MRKPIFFTFYLILSVCVWAIPNNYYTGTEGLKGEELKQRLHEIIRGHQSYSYGELWRALSYTDQDTSNPNRVILLYTGWSSSKNNHGGSASQWNREHVWAKSRGGFGTSRPAGTDLHHIRPTDVTVNSRRGHLDFDEGGTVYIDGDGPTTCRYDSDSWEPRDEVKGDVARMIFYMATRYEGNDGVADLEVVDKITKNNKKGMHGRLSILLKWHKEDPVSDFEKRRNNRIYELQKNRNPFIDHPEFAEKIWKKGSTNPPNDPPNLITVKKALELPNGSKVAIKAKIIREFNYIYGIELSDNTSEYIVVKLPREKRTMFNPVKSPNVIDREIIIKGTRGSYANTPGLVDVTFIEFTD